MKYTGEVFLMNEKYGSIIITMENASADNYVCRKCKMKAKLQNKEELKI